jgi:hypothetical protein
LRKYRISRGIDVSLLDEYHMPEDPSFWLFGADSSGPNQIRC